MKSPSHSLKRCLSVWAPLEFPMLESTWSVTALSQWPLRAWSRVYICVCLCVYVCTHLSTPFSAFLSIRSPSPSPPPHILTATASLWLLCAFSVVFLFSIPAPVRSTRRWSLNVGGKRDCDLSAAMEFRTFFNLKLFLMADKALHNLSTIYFHFSSQTPSLLQKACQSSKPPYIN